MIKSIFLALWAFCVGPVLVATQSTTSSAAGPARTIVITVTNASSSTNATSVFTPSQVTAALGDMVLFNFTEGNHTATQSAFFAPCEPLNYTNGTNGFDSNFVVVPENFSLAQGAFPIEAVPILESNSNTTMWFYDVNSCNEGGVGVINLVPGDPATAGQTLAGFIRNAERLNGTATSSSTPSSTGTGSSSSSSSTATSTQDNAAASPLGNNAGLIATICLILLTAVPLFVL